MSAACERGRGFQAGAAVQGGDEADYRQGLQRTDETEEGREVEASRNKIQNDRKNGGCRGSHRRRKPLPGQDGHCRDADDQRQLIGNGFPMRVLAGFFIDLRSMPLPPDEKGADRQQHRAYR